MPSTSGSVRIGISGWRYPGWRGVFYPEKLAQRRELEFAATQFSTIEINGTFYSLQKPEHFARWRDETPDNFIFSMKGSRFITHMLKLRSVEAPLANYFASGMLELGEKFGPVFWQFAPQMRYDRERFQSFFKLLPRSRREAASLVQRHATRGSTGRVKADGAIRHCVEIRHESFAVPGFIDLLREHDIGLVVADTVEWPLLMDTTSNFVYCRLHGSEQLYASGYESNALDIWADRISAWSTGVKAAGRYVRDEPADGRARDVFVYFDNDMNVRAPFDAQSLIGKLEA